MIADFHDASDTVDMAGGAQHRDCRLLEEQSGAICQSKCSQVGIAQHYAAMITPEAAQASQTTMF